MKRPYSPLFAVVIPKMLEAGVSENVIRKILIENPQKNVYLSSVLDFPLRTIPNRNENCVVGVRIFF